LAEVITDANKLLIITGIMQINKNRFSSPVSI